MAKMLVIYSTPKDVAAFDRHYLDIHVPLAKQLPGLKRYGVSRGPITGRFLGNAPHMVATLDFDSMADIKTAFASDAGKACAADRLMFAPNDEDLSMLFFEEDEM